MKLIFFCLLITLTNYAPFYEGLKINDSTDISSSNIDKLNKNGLQTIDEQTFSLSLNTWGRVKFIPGEIEIEGNNKVVFYLVDQNDRIRYEFPPFIGNEYGYFYELKAVDFKDINNDGLTDIVIIADYMSGVGEMGAIPFSVASIYFQKDKQFFTIHELDMSINGNLKNDSIEKVITYVHKYLKKINGGD